MSQTSTEIQDHHPLIQIQLNAADLMGVAGVGLSLLCAALVKRMRDMTRQMRELKQPALLLPKEMQRAKELLSQLAILSGADRAVLGLYHNGHLDSAGFHLSKLQILAVYCKPGVAFLPEGGRTIPIDSVPELRRLWSSPDGIMTASIKDEQLSSGCRTYMEIRDIKCLRNITLMAGTQVEVGIVGLHFCQNLCPEHTHINTVEFQSVIEEISKLATLRSTHPSALGAIHLQR